MPIVTVEWLTGRSVDKKAQVAEAITRIVADIGAVSPADVWVLFQDVAAHDWAIGGRLQAADPSDAGPSADNSSDTGPSDADPSGDAR